MNINKLIRFSPVQLQAGYRKNQMAYFVESSTYWMDWISSDDFNLLKKFFRHHFDKVFKWNPNLINIMRTRIIYSVFFHNCQRNKTAEYQSLSRNFVGRIFLIWFLRSIKIRVVNFWAFIFIVGIYEIFKFCSC